MNLTKETSFAKINKIEYIKDITESTGFPDTFALLAHKIITSNDRERKEEKSIKINNTESIIR